MNLLELKVGQKATVADFEVGWRARKRLMDLGIHVESELSLIAIHPFGGPLLLRVGGSHVALGRGVAKKIAVRIAATPDEERA